MSWPRRRRIPTVAQTLDHGIILGMYPAEDPTFGIELQRKNAGSAIWNTIYTVAEVGRQNEIQFTDRFPNDRRARSYQARHIKEGWADGAWTDTVTATPAELPTGDTPFPALSGRAIPVDLWISPGAAIKVGDQQTAAGVLNKSLVIPHSEFVPGSTATSITRTASKVIPNTLSSAQDLYAAMVLPPSVTITEISMHSYGDSTSTGTRVDLNASYSSADGSIVGLTSLYHRTTTGWVDTDSGAMTDVVSSGYLYSMQLTIECTGSVGAQFSYATVKYSMANYSYAY